VYVLLPLLVTVPQATPPSSIFPPRPPVSVMLTPPVPLPSLPRRPRPRPPTRRRSPNPRLPGPVLRMAVRSMTPTHELDHSRPLPVSPRYQIPLFASLGLRSIAVDCMGYGDTGVSDDLRDYSYKTHADVVAAIARAIGARSVVMGGHDWGGATVYRVAQWYPDLVSHVFSVCTPYPTVVKPFISTRQLSETVGGVRSVGWGWWWADTSCRVYRSLVISCSSGARTFSWSLLSGMRRRCGSFCWEFTVGDARVGSCS
jgi:hypothetical protein